MYMYMYHIYIYIQSYTYTYNIHIIERGIYRGREGERAIGRERSGPTHPFLSGGTYGAK